MNFKQFFAESNAYNEDLKKTLNKIPKKHKSLVRGYKFVFQPDNTLKGDGGHVGLIDEEKKTITVAAPWNYGREYTVLHEIGHMVWKYLIKEDQKNKWKSLVDRHKTQQAKKNPGDSLNQNAEEIFCMSYAANYCKHPVITYHNKEWNTFINKIPS